MLDDAEFRHAVGHAFESLSRNQRVLAKGIEQLSDAIACLTLSIMGHGYISEETYETVQKRVEERRKELRNEPDVHEWVASMLKATTPSEN